MTNANLSWNDISSSEAVWKKEFGIPRNPRDFRPYAGIIGSVNTFFSSENLLPAWYVSAFAPNGLFAIEKMNHHHGRFSRSKYWMISMFWGGNQK